MISFKQVAIGSRWVFLSASLALPARAVGIQFVPVGDPGNAPDTAVMHQDGTSGYGSVGYYYQIAKYDVTKSQYVEFLNAKDPTGINTLGLYNTAMTTDGNAGGITYSTGAPAGSKYTVVAGRGNQPIADVTWFSALRFANWLNNGQGYADTEDGAYTLLGGTQVPNNGDSISRNPGASVFLPSENEWYKAAYYKGGGTNAGYWHYATRSDTPPSSTPGSPGATNGANFNDPLTGYAVTGSIGYSPGQNYLTDVGSFGRSPSAYGTFDQSGDLFNWNEATVAGRSRGIRGGSWNLDAASLLSTNRDQLYGPLDANFFIGFRVAAATTSNPEPVGTTVWLIGAMALLRRRARRTRP